MPGRARPRTLLPDPYDRPWPIAPYTFTGLAEAALAAEKIVGRHRRALLAPSTTRRCMRGRIYK
jgi:hypothetical protein